MVKDHGTLLFYDMKHFPKFLYLFSFHQSSIDIDVIFDSAPKSF